MAQNILLVMAKALAKGRFNPGALNGLERFMLAQITIPDRVPTFLAATNVEPSLIDKKYGYKLLSQSTEANLEVFANVKVIVGGASLSQKFAEDIQADAFGASAPQAVEVVNGWLGRGAG